MQIPRDGTIEVADVPVPTLSDTFVLVRNHASVISAGTEKTKIDMGRKSLLAKARARPDLVRQVLRKIEAEGLMKTLRTVNTRLDSLSPLGYSCAGTVLAVGGMVTGLRPGDRVACGGADYANHAEIVAIPRNLVVKVSETVDLEEACFATVGAIALQGLRLAEPRLGETFLVVGLGLLGQLVVQLLRANGCRVIGTDLNAELVNRAVSAGALPVTQGQDVGSVCAEATHGYGVDGVLVCAGSSSNSIIEMCGAVTREKGRVVVVGAVRMDIPREPFFKKEISVVISRSYGPGRYDQSYEEKGQDYPYAYVRFSEQRNMETIIQMIAARSLDVRSLVTHRFAVDQAAAAYSLIEGERKEPYLGIVLQYSEPATAGVPSSRLQVRPAGESRSVLCVSLFGAGNYATASLLPVLVGDARVSLGGVVTATGRTAEAVRRKFGFRNCAARLTDLLGLDSDVIMIASRHDTHASAIVAAVAAGKHVYVEKPLGLSMDELSDVSRALAISTSQLMVGFNRRFAPATKKVLEHFAGTVGPRMVNIRINAGFIPRNHWSQDAAAGGGRIIGEACHFVDLAAALAESLPVTVHAFSMADPSASPMTSDNVCLALTFENGSIASIFYTAGGSKAMEKERIEVFGGGRSAAIDDFRNVTLYQGDSNESRVRYRRQDKGQPAMLSAWISGLQSGIPCVDRRTLLTVSAATVLAVESLVTAMPLNVEQAMLRWNENA
jgi:polar amino acid transport system substrate-binding protein